MADKIQRITAFDGTVFDVVWHDNGDGTYSQGVYAPAVAGTAPTNATSAALAASQVLKASAGTLLGASGFSNNVAAQYIQLHNAASLPANGTVPIVVFQVPALSPFSIDYGFWGRAFSVGIVIANSTTLATLTTGAADCWFDGQSR